jgi:hypothetical protein
MRRLHLAAEQIETGLRLFDSRPWIQTTNEHQPAAATIRQDSASRGLEYRKHRRRHPELAREPTHDPRMLRRRNPDDREPLVVDRHCLAHETRISVESSLPQTVTDDDDRMSSRLAIFFAEKCPSVHGLHAEHVEVVARDHFPPDVFDGVRVAKRELPDGVGSQAGKDPIAVAELDVARVRRRLVRLLAVAGEELDELLGMGHRTWLQQQSIDDAEDRAVGADTQRQRHDRNRDEGRSAP